MESKYQKSKIYKIVCNETGLVYIGSTVKHYLSNRTAEHRANYRRWQEGRGNYTNSFKIFDNNNYSVVLIENYPCNSKDELHRQERFHIENTPHCCNYVIPTRTDKPKMPYVCSCGSTVRTGDKSRHFKTKKHLNSKTIIK